MCAYRIIKIIGRNERQTGQSAAAETAEAVGFLVQYDVNFMSHGIIQMFTLAAGMHDFLFVKSENIKNAYRGYKTL